MKTITEFRTNGPLTPEQYTALDSAAKTGAMQVIIGRRIAPVIEPQGFGVEAIAYDTLSEMSAAQISYEWKNTANQDIVNFTRTTVPVPVLSKDFRIPYRKLMASLRNGTSLDTQAAKAAGYQVALLEDTFIFKGFAADGSNYDIKGFYNAAGNIYNTNKDFDTATNIPDAINDAMGLLLTSNIAPPYNLILNPIQYSQTNSLIANTQTSWRSWIEETIKGSVYMTPALTAGTGLLMAAGDRGFFDIAPGQDFTVLAEQLGLDKGYDLYGIAFETLVPRVFEPKAICALTAI